MGKYSYEQRLEVVLAVVEKGYSPKGLSEGSFLLPVILNGVKDLYFYN